MPATYQGKIRNGVVVFDAPAPLAEGTVVRVEPVHGVVAEPAPASDATHFRPVGSWDGPPGELDRLLADVKAAREADLDLERRAWR